MSAEAMVWAWQVTGRLPDGEALLLMALADAASEEGLTVPGREALAGKCGCSVRTISRRLGSLKEVGLIEISKTSTQGGRQLDAILCDPSGKFLPKPHLFAKGQSGSNLHSFAKGQSGSSDFPSTPPNPSHNRSQPDKSDTPVASSSSSSTYGNSRKLGEQQKATDNSTSSRLSGGPKMKVDGLVVTDDELALAEVIIEAFNKANETRFTLRGSRKRPTEHLKRIVQRLRDNPEMDAEEHVELVKRVSAKPWWEGRPGSTGVIYGPAAFARCRATDSRPTQGRHFEDERRTAEEDAPW